MTDQIKVYLKGKPDHEDLHFKKEDERLIRMLREKNREAADREYRKAHAGHCFRCGTKSLVEIERGDIKIDICVNENCGAVHLDPGELEIILKNEKEVLGIRKSFLSIFKK
jgi:hypothetical protein